MSPALPRKKEDSPILGSWTASLSRGLARVVRLELSSEASGVFERGIIQARAERRKVAVGEEARSRRRGKEEAFNPLILSVRGAPVARR
jgi:hypothetical protein